MKKQYIRANNQSPNLSLGAIGFWFLAIDYWNWPDWAYGVWGVFTAIIVIAFFVRIFSEEAVDVVRR